jgi:hypothetical protein
MFPIMAKTSEFKCKVGRWTARKMFELSSYVYVYHIQWNAK